MSASERRDEHEPEGDRIEPLLRPLLGPVYGFCLRLTGNQQDAEDLVQDAALKACNGFGSFRTGTNFKAWFFRIIVNAFYERFRRKRPEHTAVELDDVPARYLYARATELGLQHQYDDPAKALIRQLGGQIEAALERLPDEYRMVCNMYFIEDFTYREIADMLDIPIDFLDGEMTVDQVAAVERHLAECASCAGERTFERSVLLELKQQLRKTEPPASLVEKVDRLIRQSDDTNL